MSESRAKLIKKLDEMEREANRDRQENEFMLSKVQSLEQKVYHLREEIRKLKANPSHN